MYYLSTKSKIYGIVEKRGDNKNRNNKKLKVAKKQSNKQASRTKPPRILIGRKVNHEKSFRNRIPLHRRASTQYLVHKKERVVLSYQKKVRRRLSRQFLVRLCFMPN